jgi:hypothetical protein
MQNGAEVRSASFLGAVGLIYHDPSRLWLETWLQLSAFVLLVFADSGSNACMGIHQRSQYPDLVTSRNRYDLLCKVAGK